MGKNVFSKNVIKSSFNFLNIVSFGVVNNARSIFYHVTLVFAVLHLTTLARNFSRNQTSVKNTSNELSETNFTKNNMIYV